MLALLLALAACGGDTKNQAYIEKPVDDLYNKAMDQLVDENYATGGQDLRPGREPASLFGVGDQKPVDGDLRRYEDGKYDDAIIAADRFIQLHPGNADVAYAYYLKAICYYMQIIDVGRDQKTTEQALKALDDVVRRFPDSKYARDAKLKLDFTHDHLAGKEMEIGRYYLKRGEYLAAMNRFKRVIDNYQTTTHVPEALERLVECDLALGLTNEAKENAAVLGYNYPGSHWYSDAYALVTGGAARRRRAKAGSAARQWRLLSRATLQKLNFAPRRADLCQRVFFGRRCVMGCIGGRRRRLTWIVSRQAEMKFFNVAPVRAAVEGAAERGGRTSSQSPGRRRRSSTRRRPRTNGRPGSCSRAPPRSAWPR